MPDVWFRHVDPRYPFAWASSAQPAGRWHGEGEGPVQYLADTPEGAWAEFLRHEGIDDTGDLDGVERSLWAIDFELDPSDIIDSDLLSEKPPLPPETLGGGRRSYPTCQAYAQRIRAMEISGLLAPSAALIAGGARGELSQLTDLVEADDRDGRCLVLFGPRPELRGHRCVDGGRPPERVVALTVPLT